MAQNCRNLHLPVYLLSLRRSQRVALYNVRWVFILLFLLAAGIRMPKSFGQSATATASVTGAVTDPTGAKVVGAAITLTESNTGIVRPPLQIRMVSIISSLLRLEDML